MPYIAIVAILVDTETEAEAADGIAEALRPLMQTHSPQSCIRDWMYDNAADPSSLFQVGPIPEGFVPDNEWPEAIQP